MSLSGPNSRRPHGARRPTALLLCGVLLAGCGRDDIRVYRVPKQQPPGRVAGELPPGHPDISSLPSLAAPASAPSSPLSWKTPPGWEEVAPGTIRVASFRIADAQGHQADVSVIPLAGGGGGDLPNVNRWRGQLGQPPLTEQELARAAQPLEVDGQAAALYDQSGENSEGEPTRILAVIQHREGTAWFFKMAGDEPLVAAQKEAFLDFLRSFRFRPTASHAPGGEATASGPGRPRWSAPPDWQEVAAGQFLVAKYLIRSEGGAEAAVHISSAPGDGGGLEANVNRWRRQLGLTELDEASVASSLTSLGEGIRFVEMRGEKAALAGAIVRRPGESWFYKLMGDAGVVEAQKEAFRRFVQGVQY